MPSRVHALLESLAPTPTGAGPKRRLSPADAAQAVGGRTDAAADHGGVGTSFDPHVDLVQWKPPETSWHDYLIQLLTLGAEIEHALMVQYLYAAYSLGGEQVPAEHRDRVAGWRDVVLTVAREEMGHLLTVQNLLRLLGGPMNLDREEFPWDSRFLPYPFRLEPLTFESLACYLYAEMPPEKEVPRDGPYREFLDEDFPQVERIVADRTPGRHARATTVDKVYEAIIAIVKNEDWIADAAFDGDSYSLQASWDEWGKQYGPSETRPESSGAHSARRSAHHGTPRDARDGDEDRPRYDAHVIVPQMASRTQALAALEDITGQGEAPHLAAPDRRSHAPHRLDADVEPSHFDRFLGIYQAWEKCGARTPARPDGWAPSRPVPVNPTTVRNLAEPSDAPNGDADDGPAHTYIESARSRAWASLFNMRYRMLLTYLSHAFELPTLIGADTTARGGLLHRTFGEMYNLKAISGLLMRLPLRDDDGPERAGPPFAMPYTVAMPQADVDRWRLHRELLGSALRLAAQLKPHAPPEGLRYLETLEDLDTRSLAWVEERIAGLAGPRRTLA